AAGSGNTPRATITSNRAIRIGFSLPGRWKAETLASRYTSKMALVDSHPPGSFCWIELATTDQNSAKQFYASLFDWFVNDLPIGPTEVYTMFQIDGRDTGAAYTMPPQEQAQSTPAHWLVYVTVE